MEEERITGGIKYNQTLTAVPSTHEGDKVTLPVSALEELNPQDALRAGIPLTFELTLPTGRRTHAGVAEFTAAEGTIGEYLPSTRRRCWPYRAAPHTP